MGIITTHSFSHKAFTLIELLAVVAIIALIAAMLLPAEGKGRCRISNFNRQARVAVILAATHFCSDVW